MCTSERWSCQDYHHSKCRNRLAREGKRVLVIDNDPQGSLTESLGYQQPDELDITLAKIMEWVLNE